MRILKLQLPAVIAFLFSASAFGAPIGNDFQYQGRLSDAGNPATGNYDLRFAIFDAATGGSAITDPVTNLNVQVNDGLASTTLNFGAGVFNGTAYWIEIAVRTNGGAVFIPLTPRQPISASPYSLYAPNAGTAVSASTATSAGSVPWSGVAGIPAGFADGTDNDTVYTAGAGLNLAGSQFSASFGGNGSAATLSRSDHNHDIAYWRLGGNSGTTPGTHFLGTADNQPLELRVNNRRVFQFLATRSNDTFNVLGGSPLNTLDSAVMAATIAGGGTPEWFGGARANAIASDFATVGGGVDNRIGSNAPSALISGGFGHRIADGSADVTVSGGSFNWVSSNTWFATIGGGSQNRIGTNSLSSTINGGFGHRIGDNSIDGAIGGGSFNTISSNAAYVTVGGGQYNLAAATEATVSGGRLNQALGFSSAIGGGGVNTNSGDWATIAGGRVNLVAPNASYATIGGGLANRTGTNNEATVAGGAFNSALGFSSTVGGGGANTNSGAWATIPGGRDNAALSDYSFAAGRRAKAANQGAFVWSDSQNADFNSSAANQFSVRAAGGVRFVTGGAGATIDGQPVLSGAVTGTLIADGTVSAADVTAATFATTFWKADGNSGTTAGTHFLGTTDNQPLELRVNGQRVLRLEPSINDAPILIGGSLLNMVDAGAFGATIAGGGGTDPFFGPAPNRISSRVAFIGGGAGNWISTNANGSVIGGGYSNLIGSFSAQSTIGGGVMNTIPGSANESFIGGGWHNTIQIAADRAVIAGGDLNSIGRFSRHSFIGGGQVNVVQSNASYSVIGGGFGNATVTNVVNTVVGGGYSNRVAASYSFVGGGTFNLASGVGAFVGSGGKAILNPARGANNIASGLQSVVVGGLNNTAEGQFSFVGGGGTNLSAGDYATISGGFQNVAGDNEAAVGGGAFNTALGFSSVIGGGGVNSAEGLYATVPGGFANLAQGSYSFAAGLNARANHARAFVWSGYDNAAPSFQPSRLHVLGTNGLSVDYSTQRPDGGGGKWVVIGGEIDFPGTVIQAYNGAYLSEAGVWQDVSDKNRKTDFAPINPREVLDQVLALPVQEWRYTNEVAGVRHIGPTAQDFHAAFEVGTDDKTIGAVDANGVALAAIQGLNQKLTKDLKAKDAEIGELKQNVAELRELVVRLNERWNGGAP